ncbi:MAG: Gfo/Idh/MocA family protein [Planctomycetota bacterium]|jgi:predicted dehydrogenase
MNKSAIITRRSFLRRTAGVAAGTIAFPYFVPSSVLGKTGVVAPSNRIVMGAIGYGWQGGSNTGGLLNKPEVQYVAVCDVDKNHLEKAKAKVDEKYGNKDCAAYGDFRELIARGDLDAVNIALPDHWHSVPAIMAAEAGLDIHGEKPLSHTLVEGRAMCDAIRQYGRIWQTGSWQRSKENFHRACELVVNERIGKVHRVEVGLGQGFSDYAKTKDQQSPGPPPAELDYDFWLGPAPWAPYCPARVHKNWRWHLDYGGGRLMDWVGHHVDIAHWGLGFDYTGPVEVEGWGRYPKEGVWNAPTDYECTCKYANGVELVMSSTLAGGTKWYGDKGWVYVSRGRLDANPKSVLDDVIGPDETRLYHSRDHLQNFLDCIKSRQATITPCEVAHRSASVGHLSQIAMWLGRKIRFNPDTEQIIDDPTAAALLGKAMRGGWHL